MAVDPAFFGFISFNFPAATGTSLPTGDFVGTDLDHSPADIIRSLLSNISGIGSLPSAEIDWPISCSLELPNPDNTITVFDTQGTDDGYHQTNGEVQGMNGIQIRIRGTDHQTGWRKSNQVYNTLSKGVYQVYVVIDEIYYLVHSVTITSDILPLGEEAPKSRRQIFTINAVASILRIVSN
jgi:hypothetical protein